MHQTSHTAEATAASRGEKTVRMVPVFRRWDFAIFGLLSALQLFLVGQFFVSWFRVADLRGDAVTVWILTILVGSRILVRAAQWLILPRMRRPASMTVQPGWKVGVATTFVPGLESIEMLEQTVRALVAMDYPHQTWVLDEGDSDEVKDLCRRLGAFHFSRKDMPHYQAGEGRFQNRTKYGNYNAWFHEVGFVRYDIVVGFDPDHVPTTDFLTTALGYFEDESVGYVQLPQIYYNQNASFIARGAAEETYAYYSSIQQAAYGGGWPLVTGCHNAHRVSALNDIEGFPPHDADDMLVTFLYREKGWQGVYVPEIRARGLTPVDWSGYLSQQLRWARSVLDIKFRVLPKIRTGLPLLDRILAQLHGLSYLKGPVALAGTLLLGVLLATGRFPFLQVGGLLRSLLILMIVFYVADLYRQRFFLDFKGEWGLHWRAGILQYAKWPFLVLALINVILDRKTAYRTTPKLNSRRPRRFVLLWPHLGIVLLLGGAWAIGVLSGVHHHPLVVVWAASMIAASLLLMLTEFMRFPTPYDQKHWTPTR